MEPERQYTVCMHRSDNPGITLDYVYKLYFAELNYVPVY